MEKMWMLVTDNYSGLAERAVNMLAGTVSGYLKYVLPVKYSAELTESDIEKYDLIVLGIEGDALISRCIDRGDVDRVDDEEGYSVYVGECVLNSERRMVLISASHEHGLLYGAMAFLNRYLGKVVTSHGALPREEAGELPFNTSLPTWRETRTPAVRTRAVWTWGHVIYDYRSFFDNMMRLGLNEAVIWNDKIPFNATRVVDYAHNCGIKVVWGYAWGWDQGGIKNATDMTGKSITLLEDQIVERFEREYRGAGDGIYFQSFTEHAEESVGGNSVADTVTDLVNRAAGRILAVCPDLHIQFGLHATSVKNKLDVLRRVDPRVTIVWEDCGAFPYNYSPYDVSTLDETLAFTDDIATLRGSNEKFGVVLKGMVNLDWLTFRHFDEKYIMGERTDAFITARLEKKQKYWKSVTAGWLANADAARRTVALIAERNPDAIVEALIEDGLFEAKIPLPAAIYAELLWDPTRPVSDIISDVTRYPCVEI